MSNNLLAEIQSLETELHHSGTRTSRARLEQLLHPDFHEVGRSGRRYDRETVIRFLAAQPDLRTDSADFKLEQLAEDCVLLTYQSCHHHADQPSDYALRSSIWRKTSEGWQLYYHQGTPSAPDGG